MTDEPYTNPHCLQHFAAGGEVHQMNFNEYQNIANQTDQQPGSGAIQDDPYTIMVPLLGLAGEAGELLAEHKKWLRDGNSYKLFPERVTEELGDLLWYLTNVATKHGRDLGDIACSNLERIRALGRDSARHNAQSQQERLSSRVELNEYQQLANQTDPCIPAEVAPDGTYAVLIPMLGLAGKAGALLGDHEQWFLDGASFELRPERVAEQLGSILWYLCDAASKHGLHLEDVASYNLDKISRRWGPATRSLVQCKLFDGDYPEHERLPRQMDILIKPDGPGKTLTFVNGNRFGDPLTDNQYEDDGYRFHDIFHLSFASMLSWSPTVRALLRRKRKSNPVVDEIEDGGRAMVLEEGISALVFSYAERRNYLDGAEGVDYALLRNIREMTAHLEVGCRTEADWERAIVTSFQLWREVRRAGEGHIYADLEKGTIWMADTPPAGATT